MTTWTALTDAQRTFVRDMLDCASVDARESAADFDAGTPGRAGFEADAEAYEAARAALLAASEKRIAIEAVATRGWAATGRDLQAEKLRRERDEARAEVVRLREALTTWCCCCWDRFGPKPRDARPAAVRLQWSDRIACYCVDHLPEAVVNIALDHSYDRGGIDPDVEIIEPAPVLGLPPAGPQVVAVVEAVCVAARAYLDEATPEWGERTVDLGDEQHAELLARCRAAGAEPTP